MNKQRSFVALRKRCRCIIVPLFVVGCLTSFALQAADAAEGKQLVKPKPPKMPVFDEAKVRQLLSQIDSSNNAMFLKIGYFSRRGNPMLPLEEGYAMLRSSLAESEPGSTRWYNLQLVCGHAVFRIPHADVQDGFDAYNKIFDFAGTHIEEVRKTPRSVSLVRQAIREYTSTVAGRMNDLSLYGDARIENTARAAWKISMALAGADGGKASLREPRWGEALEKAKIQNQLLPAIEASMKDPQVPRTYSLLRTAAVALAPADPQRALEVLREAKPLLPRDDLTEVGWFYGRIVDLTAPDGTVDSNQLRRAAQLQQEMTQITGRGYARLISFLLATEEVARLDPLLSDLRKPDSNELEVIQSVVVLIANARIRDGQKEILTEKAGSVIKAYLTGKRLRDPLIENKARAFLNGLQKSAG